MKSKKHVKLEAKVGFLGFDAVDYSPLESHSLLRGYTAFKKVAMVVFRDDLRGTPNLRSQ